MRLSELGIRNSESEIQTDPEIRSVHYRAQDVRNGGLFVAIRGLKADGHDFIDQAIARGASVIVTQKSGIEDCRLKIEDCSPQPVFAKVENTRKALAEISSRFHGNPSEKLFVIGITGTNGKTTITYLIESILSKAGCKVGVIGTINYRYSGKIFENPVTTPESSDLQAILAQMLKHGITHVVMEASSHAIDLFRLECCWLDIGVFTNLSQDHLDYHKDMDSYWSCKKRLFTENLGTGPKKSSAVINCNTEKGEELVRLIGDTNKSVECWKLSLSQQLAVGSQQPAASNKQQATSNKQQATSNHEITADACEISLSGIAGRISTPNGLFGFRSPLVGRHNLENILCAVGVGAVLSLSPDTIRAGTEAVTSIPGRLERVTGSAVDMERFVYVDYAHTPDALENVLTSLRIMTSGRLICVFGCGGDRDKGKRPQMGEIAGRLCDLAVITSDNPRTEEPGEIIKQILYGIRNLKLETGNQKPETQNPGLHEYMLSDLETGFEKKGYVAEPDRRKAIQLSIMASQVGDAILIAGKGHETYQIIGNRTLPFDDREEAEKAISTIQTSR